MIVKNLAVAVFGIKVLQNSSITGMKCNKFKELKPKPKLEEDSRYWRYECRKKVIKVINLILKV